MVKCHRNISFEDPIYTEPLTGKMMDFDYSEEYLSSISNAISHSVDIYIVHKITRFIGKNIKKTLARYRQKRGRNNRKSR